MKKISKVEELRLRMLKQTEDMINETKKRMTTVDEDKLILVGKLTALAAVKATLMAGGKHGQA